MWKFNFNKENFNKENFSKENLNKENFSKENFGKVLNFAEVEEVKKVPNFAEVEEVKKSCKLCAAVQRYYCTFIIFHSLLSFSKRNILSPSNNDCLASILSSTTALSSCLFKMTREIR